MPTWRHECHQTKPGAEVDVATIMGSGNTVVAMVRYPPSALRAGIAGFQNRDDADKPEANITGAVLASAGKRHC
jgi:hypothetical protein